MALKNLASWSNKNVAAATAAASFAQGGKLVKQAMLATGTACGAGKPNPDPKPSACGTACGAGK